MRRDSGSSAVSMLWVDHATRLIGPIPADAAAAQAANSRCAAPGDAACTLQSEESFSAVIATGGHARQLAEMLQCCAVAMDSVVDRVLRPEGVHLAYPPRVPVLSRLSQNGALQVQAGQARTEEETSSLVIAPAQPSQKTPVAFLRVLRNGRASLAEIDAPPLFLARDGRLVLLPVIEEEQEGRLVRRCDFQLRDGDHLAMASDSFVMAAARNDPAGCRDGGRAGAWRGIAASVRRLTETRCSARQLLEALERLYVRLPGGEAGRLDGGPAVIVAMFVRPMRTVTVWSGPPADPAQDSELLGMLLGEEGTRVICGDTTAEIVARLLGARLALEPRPVDGWKEVPPASSLVGVLGDDKGRIDLITEGVVTLRVARQRISQSMNCASGGGHSAPTLGEGRPAARGLMPDAGNDTASDGATRLARLLRDADRVRFLVGSAVNPAQVDVTGEPLRLRAVAELAEELQARGKLVMVDVV